MMFGGATPLFDAGALDGDEPTADRPNKTGGMFDDDSDDDAFLNNITKPASEQKASILQGTKGGGVT